MYDALKLLVLILLCSLDVPAQTAAPDADAKPVELQKDEGEPRTRRPREGFSSPASEFLLKIGPKTSGSKHLLLFTEEIPPGAAIPKHKHQETGNAHVWLGDKEYDTQPSALVFIPVGTWISLKNIGHENIHLVSVWNEPGFEEMLRCGSVPKGQAAEPISRDGVKECYHLRDAELEAVQPVPDKKP